MDISVLSLDSIARIDPSPFFILSLIPYLVFLRYAGKTKAIPKMVSIGIGFVFFYLSFELIYREYASKSELGTKLFKVLVFLWSLYGVAANFSHIPKNISYNMLDIVSKNFYGLYIYYRIKELSNQNKLEDRKE